MRRRRTRGRGPSAVPLAPRVGKTETVSTPHPVLPYDVTLDDGTRLHLRLGTSADREALIAGFEHLSPESRTSRFFTAMPRLAPTFLDRLLDVDRSRHVAIAAFDRDRPGEVGEEGFGVGVARYHRNADDPTEAEAAVAVIDEYQGRGIGRILLDALVAHAIGEGVETFTAMVLTSNQAMLHVFADMGASIDWDPDDRQVVHLRVPVDTEHLQQSVLAALLRHSAAWPTGS